MLILFRIEVGQRRQGVSRERAFRGQRNCSDQIGSVITFTYGWSSSESLIFAVSPGVFRNFERINAMACSRGDRLLGKLPEVLLHVCEILAH